METINIEKTPKKTLTKEELKHINGCLSWGMKKELADFLGLSPANITYLLKRKPVYNITEKKFEDKCIMEERTYNQILNFIDLTSNE